MVGREKEPVPGSRGERVKWIKEAFDQKHGYVTVKVFAAKLNIAARELGLHGVWTGTRFSKIVHGQEPNLEDAACLIHVDPEQRGWDWLARGVQVVPAVRKRAIIDIEGDHKPTTPAKRTRRRAG